LPLPTFSFAGTSKGDRLDLSLDYGVGVFDGKATGGFDNYKRGLTGPFTVDYDLSAKIDLGYYGFDLSLAGIDPRVELRTNGDVISVTAGPLQGELRRGMVEEDLRKTIERLVFHT